MIGYRAPTPRERRISAARWCIRHSLTYDQGLALLLGLARVGIYLRVEEDGEGQLHMMGGGAGPATLRGFMMLHGVGPTERG